MNLVRAMLNLGGRWWSPFPGQDDGLPKRGVSVWMWAVPRFFSHATDSF